MAAAARIALGPRLSGDRWQELNRELFTALRVQQYALFLVLGLIVLVSTFNVASTLVVLVRERMRDVGVLAALGLPPRGWCVSSSPMAASWAAWHAARRRDRRAALVGARHLRADPLRARGGGHLLHRSVPFRVEAGDLLAIVAFALAVTLLASWRPPGAPRRPSAALRYE